MRQSAVLFFDSHSGFFDGAQQSLYLLIKHLDRARFRPIFMGPEEGVLTRRLAEMGVATVVARHDARLGRYGGAVLRENVWGKSRLVFPYLAYTWRIKRIIRNEKVEIVHCNSIRSLLTVGPVARMCGVPVIWHHRLDQGSWDRVGVKLADRVIVVANSLRKNLNIGPADQKKFITIYNGVDLIEFGSQEDPSVVRKDLGIEPGWQAIMMIGSVTPRKSQLDFLMAASRVIRVLPRTKFVIVGEARGTEAHAYAERLRSYIAAESLDRHVIFSGWRLDVPRILRGMDLFALPSLNEGLPRAILEAMTLSLPVVATSVGGNEELVVHGKTGFLVPAQDPAALAASITEILQNPELARSMGQLGRKRIEAQFSLKASVRGVEHVMDDLLSGRPVKEVA
jgi:glycosyltransferase involved in cell wall biosynthesis